MSWRTKSKRRASAALGRHVESREVSPMRVKSLRPSVRAPWSMHRWFRLEGLRATRGGSRLSVRHEEWAAPHPPSSQVARTAAGMWPTASITSSAALAAFVTASLGFSSSRTRLCRAGREKSQPSKSRRKSKKEARSSGFRDHRPPDRDRCLCLWTPYLGTAFRA